MTMMMKGTVHICEGVGLETYVSVNVIVRSVLDNFLKPLLF
jgi:hypothetical protein